jgi:acyl-CoA thioester hydrolase
MQHKNIVKVYYADTDSYGIVWHGAYIKWFEVARVEISAMLDIDFKILESMGVQMPVVELNVRYKSPARALDELLIESEVGELKKTSITFNHKITNLTTGKIVLNANSTVVTTDIDGKLYRKIPDYIFEKYNTSSID